MIRGATQMLSTNELPRLQREQFHHDQRNHLDILCMPKPDRLKHYGLHFAKYVGRLARGSAEPKPQKQTLVDALLISLSAANTLHQDLASIGGETTRRPIRSIRFGCSLMPLAVLQMHAKSLITWRIRLH
jgi:hypothetical protein